MPTAKRILVTCVGSGVGQSVVDSLKHFKDEYFLVGSDQSRHVYSVPDCDDFISLPAISAANYLDELLAACARLRVDVVIPGHDLELPLFARHRSRFDVAGVEVVVSDPRLVVLLRDKLAWSREFRKRTHRVVATCSVAEYRSGEHHAGITLPAIAKPGGGSASAGLAILHRPEDAAGLPDGHIIQPFLFPTDDDPDLPVLRAAVATGKVVQISEISVQLIYSKDGRLLDRFASRNRLKAGVPVEVVPVDSADVWSAVDEMIEVLRGYEPRGPVNLQGRLTPDGLVFFEMNPRFTGITGNRSQFGFNEVALVVDNFTVGDSRALRVNRAKVGVRQVACRSWPAPSYRFGQEGGRQGAPAALAVLGATSWLARHFIAERAAAGHEVVAVCRQRSVAQATGWYSGMKNVSVVSAESSSLKDVLGWAEVLVNFASGRPPHGAQAILDAHVFQQRMFDLAEIFEVPRLIHISSQSVYAAVTASAKDEDAPLETSDPYAISKYLMEEAVRSLARRRPSMRGVSLRLARLFGAAAGLRVAEFPHRAVSSALAGETIELRGAGNVLDLLDIRDAVRAVSFFVEAGDTGWRGEVFNVGSGDPVTLAQYVGMVDAVGRKLHGRGLRVVEHDAPVSAPSGLDCTKLARTGWVPRLGLEQSISDLFGYFANAAR
jgi:nucleoside-diphosphate-sugar epimerase